MKRRLFLQGAGGLGVLAYAGCDGNNGELPDGELPETDDTGEGEGAEFPGITQETLDTMEALADEVLADTPWASEFPGAFTTFGEFLNELHSEYPAAAEAMRQMTEAGLPFMKLVADVKRSPPASQEELEEAVFPKMYDLIDTLSGMESTVDDMLQEIVDEDVVALCEGTDHTEFIAATTRLDGEMRQYLADQGTERDPLSNTVCYANQELGRRWTQGEFAPLEGTSEVSSEAQALLDDFDWSDYGAPPPPEIRQRFDLLMAKVFGPKPAPEFDMCEGMMIFGATILMLLALWGTASSLIGGWIVVMGWLAAFTSAFAALAMIFVMFLFAIIFVAAIVTVIATYWNAIEDCF